MSVRPTTPNLPDGKLPPSSWDFDDVGDYASWDDWVVDDVVDADLIRQNVAAIFAHVNGHLNGTDIKTDASAISEATYIDDWESGNNLWPVEQARHTHDGIDSAKLADDIIGHSHLPSRAFGMMRSPTKDYRGLLLFGRVVADRDTGPLYDSYLYYRIAIPYNPDEWGTQYLYRASTGGARVCLGLMIPSYSSWSVEKQRELFIPYADITEVTNQITDVDVAVRMAGSTYALNAGYEFFWFITALV